MEYASPEDLTDGDADLLDVELPSGKVVQVRGLSREEHLWLAKGDPEGAEIERRILTKGLVQPLMSDRALKAWQRKPGASRDLNVAVRAIRDLSGFGEGADKSGV